PTQVTALTGIDAISHAVETYVTKRRNPISLMFSRESFRLLAGNFQHVINDPEYVDARASMQLGAAYAGLAIENSMLGAAHALANPLTAEFGIPHGQAVGVMLPHVVRFNGKKYNSWYQELVSMIETMLSGVVAGKGAYGLADFLAQLLRAAGLEDKLEPLGVTREDFPRLAASAAKQWTGSFNPRGVDSESLQQLYEQAY
ncbi:MAG: iron-containing alcohol dehydrogenase, partial [Planctomycetota bacterium]|nr:iron-containing alcohol dehydrogenase [Planctomycetota bacterium]